ncbi:hypothetical protein DVH24_041141 [Malus domestica]|uniref:Uncharacterized protein n=1 Tax=Malus domestica TaxID=3750 RepID=A0A498ID31_MALDO|nr:hypothetical protein DVH24_041141 [Malus domestica]
MLPRGRTPVTLTIEEPRKSCVFAFQTLIMIYSVKEFLEDGVYIPTDVKVKQMKRVKSDCVTVQKKFSNDRDPVVTAYKLWGFSCDSKMIVWNKQRLFLVRSDMPLRVLAKFIGVQLVNFHIQLYFNNTVPPIGKQSCSFFFLFPKLFADLVFVIILFLALVAEALMSEFDAENKGDNGDLHRTYTSKGKEDDSESLIGLRVELLQGVT